MNREEEANLIRRVTAGETGCFALLVDAYKGPVFLLAYRMTGSRMDAEDIAQETFIRAYKSLKGFDISRRFFPWLYSIGINVVRGRLKNKGRDSPSLIDFVAPSNSEPGPEDRLIEKQRAGQVQKALLDLDPDKREAVILRYMHGLTFDELAESLGISASGAKMRVYRGLDQLKQLLQDDIKDRKNNGRE